MHSTTLTGCALLATSMVFAQTTYDTQTTPDLAFEPNTFENVAEGDIIRVTFGMAPHNILSGTWANPCVYDAAGGINSGIWEDGEVFTFMINSTDPQIFFCSVGMHCQQGMALVINPSGVFNHISWGSDTLEAYQTAAEETTSEGPESDGPEGGMLEEDGDDDDEDDGSDAYPPSSTTPGPDSTMPPATSEPAQYTGAASSFGPGAAMFGAIVAGGLAFAN